MELFPGKRFEKYEIIKRLATGGMAEVYLARTLGHAGFSRPIALKRILPDFAREQRFREMFLREASVTVHLDHPNIVRVLDFIEEDGELILAMEYINGTSLKELHNASLSRTAIDNSPGISPLLAATIGERVAKALDHAWHVPGDHGHPLHIVHRDVSPQNILLSYEGDVKLVDFGIAKPANENTSIGGIKGKLQYLSPEQAKSEELDECSDIFALGIVLYEVALNLSTPLFAAENQAGVLYAVLNREIIPPVSKKPDFPPRLSSVIMQALARKRKNRFQSAEEFASALNQSIHLETTNPAECDLVAYMRSLYGETKKFELAHLLSKQKVHTKKPEKIETSIHYRAKKMLNNSVPLAPIEQSKTIADISVSLPGTILPINIPIEITETEKSDKRKLRIGVIAGLLVAVLLGAFIVKKIMQKTDDLHSSTTETLRSSAAGQNKVATPSNHVSPPPSELDSANSTKVKTDAQEAILATKKDQTTTQVQRKKPINPPPRRKKKQLAIKKPETGTLVINLRPYGWAIIGIDGETPKLNDTPEITRKLSAGPHYIRIASPNGKVITSKKIEIKSGKNTVVNIGNLLSKEQH